MITDFFPIPEIGCRYKSKVGDLYIIKDVQTDLGSIPDYVEFVCESAPDGPTIEYTAEDWNALDAVKVTSEPIPDPKPEPDPEPEPEPEPTPNPGPNPQPSPKPIPELDPDPILSDGIYSNDPRINELAKLLQDGPKKFNQEFYPTDKTLSDNNMVEHDVEDAFQKTLDEIDDLRARGEYDHPFIEDVDENGKKIRRVNPNRKRRSCGLIQEFLWTCGGLDKSLLRMCPTDWAKKAGMGGTILGTAILATLSMGYAAYTVASIGIKDEKSWVPGIAAFVIGIIWGLVIFNLDRYLVNSMYSDGESTISMREFKSGLPRIIIAFFLGIVISTPIEMKIFEGKINEYIIANDKDRMDDSSLLANSSKLRELKTKLDKQKKDVELFKKDWMRKDSLYVEEHTKGQNGSSPGYGPKAEQLEKDKNEAKTIYNNADTLLRNLQTQYDQELAKVTKDQKSDLSLMQGFSRRIDALLHITSFHRECKDNKGNPVYKTDKDGKKTNEIAEEFNPLWLVQKLIMLMFIILEVLPVFNKMMQENGRYDKLIDLESNTMDKLTRAKAFNDINVLRSGNLSMYRNQIIFGKVPSDIDKDFNGIVDEDPESQNAFEKQDYKKRNKNETDEDNYKIYSYARKRCTQYIKIRIDRIFQGVLPDDAEEDFIAQDVSKSHSRENRDQTHDPSNEAEKI